MKLPRCELPEALGWRTRAVGCLGSGPGAAGSSQDQRGGVTCSQSLLGDSARWLWPHWGKAGGFEGLTPHCPSQARRAQGRVYLRLPQSEGPKNFSLVIQQTY